METDGARTGDWKVRRNQLFAVDLGCILSAAITILFLSCLFGFLLECVRNQNHLDKIALHARSSCKNRPGLLVIRPGQLTVPHNAQAAELRCEYFKGN